MGVGKSTVGSALVGLLRTHCTQQINFIDLDGWIEEHTGMSVVEIFSRHGEMVFRQYEEKYCREIIAQAQNSPDCLVFALGGGTLHIPNLGQYIAQNTQLFVLSASLDRISKRVEHTERPLRKNIEELWTQRQAGYAQFGTMIATNGCTVVEVVEKIVAHLQIDVVQREGHSL